MISCIALRTGMQDKSDAIMCTSLWQVQCSGSIIAGRIEARQLAPLGCLRPEIGVYVGVQSCMHRPGICVASGG